jgi:hypothetical protein
VASEERARVQVVVDTAAMVGRTGRARSTGAADARVEAGRVAVPVRMKGDARVRRPRRKVAFMSVADGAR